MTYGNAWINNNNNDQCLGTRTMTPEQRFCKGPLLTPAHTISYSRYKFTERPEICSWRSMNTKEKMRSSPPPQRKLIDHTLQRRDTATACVCTAKSKPIVIVEKAVLRISLPSFLYLNEKVAYSAKAIRDEDEGNSDEDTMVNFFLKVEPSHRRRRRSVSKLSSAKKLSSSPLRSISDIIHGKEEAQKWTRF